MDKGRLGTDKGDPGKTSKRTGREHKKDWGGGQIKKTEKSLRKKMPGGARKKRVSKP